MKITLTINEEERTMEVELNASLLSLLRSEKLMLTRRGCEKGVCGSCVVSLNGFAVPSCFTPVMRCINANVVTLEHFMKGTFYADIMAGFDKAGVHLCGYCNAGKVFLARDIIEYSRHPSFESIKESVKNLTPCCVDCDTYARGVLYAREIHKRNMERK